MEPPPIPVAVRRVGAVYDPPALLVEYRRAEGGEVVHRRLGLGCLRGGGRRRRGNGNGDACPLLLPPAPAFITDALYAARPSLLGGVPRPLILEMVGRISDRARTRRHAALGDLNRARGAEAAGAAAEMDAAFAANAVAPGGEGYAWDRRVEFDPPADDSSWD